MFSLLSKLPSLGGQSVYGDLRAVIHRSVSTTGSLYQLVKFELGDSESDLSDGCNVDLRDVHLNLGGDKLTFNLTWLRDSCHCKLCTHPPSRQRLFTSTQFKKDIFTIKDVKPLEAISKNNSDKCVTRYDDLKSIKVTWADGHQSEYSMDWLRYVNRYFRNSERKIKLEYDIVKLQYPEDDLYAPSTSNKSHPIPWTVAEIGAKLRPISYSDLIDGYEWNESITSRHANRPSEMSPRRYKAMRNVINQLTTNGLAKISAVPPEPETILRVARTIAYERTTGYGTVFNVVVEPSEDVNLAYTSQEFDLHSDLTYREMSPGVQLLHCIRNSPEGGNSYFSDALNACNILHQSNPHLFKALVQFPATFAVRDPYRDVIFRRQIPVLNLNAQGELDSVYYSPFMLPPIGHHEDVRLFYLAYDRLTQLLHSRESKYIFKMEPGDLFIFHNRRVLHGRSAYDPRNSNRFLQGTYMDWDEIVCLGEKFRAHENNLGDR